MGVAIFVLTIAALIVAVALIASGVRRALDEMFDDWDDDHY